MALKFDEMTVDTSLAQEYIKENKDVSELYEDYKNSTENFEYFEFDGKVLTKRSKDYVDNDSLDDLCNSAPRTGSVQALAASLKQNATLITQLEYLIRNIPIEDTRHQLTLIFKYLNYCCIDEDITGKKNEMFLSEEPLHILLMLGVVMENDKEILKLSIKSKALTIITHLVVKLLYQAGFHKIQLKFRECATGKTEWISKEIKELDTGTVAVVSEDADIDSAVDKFLSVSKQASWRLRRILVQESIYQQFKDALRWKCNLKQQGKDAVICSASETLPYNGKSFLIDPVDLPTDEHSVVTVEAYRTRKEMISLIQADKARFLSLWANDIAEINEVTHNTKSPVVWVNNIADFRGPPPVAAAVLSDTLTIEMNIKKCDKISQLCRLLQSWLKLDYETRRDILCNALDQFIEANPTNKDYAAIRRAISACTRKSFINVGKDYVCVGIWMPVGIRAVEDLIENPLSKDMFMSILNGDGFIVRSPSKDVSQTFEVFELAGVPLVKLEEFIPGDFPIKHWSVPDNIKVIWTNTGTIFAN